MMTRCGPYACLRREFSLAPRSMAPVVLLGATVVVDHVGNYQRGLPWGMALLKLFDPRTGMPLAIRDATDITEMRTGAVTALGAKYLAPPKPRVLGHVGARGTAYWNVRLLDRLFDFQEIRVHSRRPGCRRGFAARLSARLGKPGCFGVGVWAGVNGVLWGGG